MFLLRLYDSPFCCLTVFVICAVFFAAFSNIQVTAATSSRIDTGEFLFSWDTGEVTGAAQDSESSKKEENWRSVLGTSRTEVHTLERVLTGLLLTVILIAAIAWAARGKRLMHSSGYVNLIDDSMLVPGIRILVFEVMGKILVTAQTEKGLTLLTEITDEELVNHARLEAGKNNPGTFKEALGVWMAGGDRNLRHKQDVGFIRKSIQKLRNKGHEDD